MSDAIEMSNTSKIQVTGTSSIVLVGHLQNIQPSYQLNRKNYLKWSQFVRTIFKGNGKLSHLLGKGPKPGDPKFDTWDEADSMVMPWLWNSMMPEVIDTCMFLETTKNIWDIHRQTYSKVCDAAQIYDIKTRILTTKQGNCSITKYFNILHKTCGKNSIIINV